MPCQIMVFRRKTTATRVQNHAKKQGLKTRLIKKAIPTYILTVGPKSRVKRKHK